jgi:Protein of unknown function (DUF2569)
MNEMQDETLEPVGVGGWLILVAIAVCLSPLRVLVSVVNTFRAVAQDGAWSALTTPGSSAYHPMWASVIVYELLGNLALLVASVALLVLFIQRSRKFPRLFIWIAALTFPFLVVDAWLGSLLPLDEPVLDKDTVKGLMASVVTLAIWVPYMLRSKRVRNTFVA